jgi:hypothetical protein
MRCILGLFAFQGRPDLALDLMLERGAGNAVGEGRSFSPAGQRFEVSAGVQRLMDLKNGAFFWLTII